MSERVRAADGPALDHQLTKAKEPAPISVTSERSGMAAVRQNRGLRSSEECMPR